MAHPALSYRAAVRVPWARFLPPLSEPGVPISGTGLSRGPGQWSHAARTRAFRLRPAAAGLASRRTRLTPCRWPAGAIVRPVDALTTATARVVPFAYACDDVWHSCSFVGVIGRSATPGACSRSPSLPPEAPSLGRHCPASTVVRASPPPWPARPCPHGSSVGACHATGRASRVASIPLFHTCRRHYPGGTGRCSRRSLPDRWQPSPIFRRVGFRVTRFEACSAFTSSLRPVWSLNRPRRPFVVGVLQPMSLPPSSAPTATGWSDSCRAGFAPAEEWRLFTAH